MEFILYFFLIFGAAFTFIAALGVVRLPDFYCRVHAATKAGAFGGTLMLIAAGLSFGSLHAWAQVLLTIIFFYMTAPVASHLLSRAAARTNVPRYTKHRAEEKEEK